jgi:outer membrane protein OmpA-like peptidoglycan-associated protein
MRSMMRPRTTVSLVALASLAAASMVGCGGNIPPPKALVDARAEYQSAKDGVAMQLDPTDVHEADLALQKAEAAWNDSQDPSDEHPLDLAIVAQRKAQIASAEAAASKAQNDLQQAKTDLQAALAAQLNAAKGQLNQTQQALNTTQTQLQQTAAQAAAQKAQLADLEARLKDARDTIAKIAAVKDDSRGMVITLQGEVLFTTGKSDLKPAAMAKLDQIADALRGKEQPMVVYGYTDNVGTYDNNITLSQKRGQAVRDYLVTKGIPNDLITAQGKGPDSPVAENTSVEGRAQNRRVEIVVQPKK